MWQNCRRRVFRWYRRVYGTESSFTKKQKLGAAAQAVGITVFLGLFFYRSFQAAFLMVPAGLFYLDILEKKTAQKKRERLKREFQDAMLSIAANLRAGYAVENAVGETLQEMKLLHGKASPIYQEFYKIVQGLANRISIETLMGQFAKRAALEEIQEFADIFAIAKKSGGNMTEIMHETAAIIGEKIEVEKEIQVLLSAKKLEQNVMSVIPFAIILYVSAASKGYFDALYTTFVGRAVMTVCLVMYVAAYALGRRITEIQV